MNTPASIAITTVRLADLLAVRALDPELVWVAHAHEPWRPRTIYGITPALSGSPGFRARRGIRDFAPMADS